MGGGQSVVKEKALLKEFDTRTSDRLLSLTFLDEFEEDLDEDAVLGGLQRVVAAVRRGPAGRQTDRRMDG